MRLIPPPATKRRSSTGEMTMISVSRFKKVFLILTAFVCVITSVSMKAKADYEPMNVLKTSSLNTAMPQGDVIIDNLNIDNVQVKIFDTKHFTYTKEPISEQEGIGSGYGTLSNIVHVTTDSTITYPQYAEFKNPFEVIFKKAAHDRRGALVDITMHMNIVKFSPSPKSKGMKLDGTNSDCVFSMYTDKNDGISVQHLAPGDFRVSRIRNVCTLCDVTTSLTYSDTGKTVNGTYLTKYCDLDMPNSMDNYTDYNLYPPESIWLLDGYKGSAYVSNDTMLNETAWKEYSGRYFAATTPDDDNTIAATRSSVLTYANAASSRYRWYGYGCGTLVLVNKTGAKVTPKISTKKNVSTVYGGNTHIFNVTETGGASGICEIKSDFNYARSEEMPKSWAITDTFPTDIMTAPQVKDVRIYTKPLADVISDDGTELPDASGYKSGTTEITNQVSVSRDSDGKLRVVSSNYNLVSAKRVYVEFTAPIKPWNSIADSDKIETSTKEFINSETTTVNTTDMIMERKATAPFSARLNVSPHISIVKMPHLADSNGNGKADTGEKVTYTFSIRNDGNSSLSNIRLTDSLLGFTDRKVADSIATGGTKEYSAPEAITVTADQARSGKIDNTATVKGTPPSGMSGVTATGKATVPTVAPAPKLTLEKTVDRKSLSSAESKVGTKLTYTFKVTNAGNVNIGNISINDKLPGVSAIKMTYPTGDGILAPGATATGTATYSLTDSDIARYGVTNTAQASGTDKATGNAVKSNESSVTTSVVQSAGLSIAKTVNKASLAGDAAKAGTDLTYTFKISNNGNVAIDGISIRDDMAGLSNISMTWPGASGSLGVGQSATGTATYKVKQSDVDAGTVSNTARATGTNHATGVSVSSNESTATTTIDRTLRLGVSKTADPTRIPAAEAIPGKTISYAIAVKNNGNTTADISAVDSMPEIGAVSMSKSRLAPGETAPATVSHAVTSGDIGAGTVSNTVTVNGRTIDGSMTTSGKATATTSIDRQRAALTLKKSVDKSKLSGNEARVGTVLTYSFEIANTGNVTVNGIAIDDELDGIGAIKMNYPSKAGELAPGEKAAGKAAYTVTQSDVQNGRVTNRAKAAGKNVTTGAAVETSKVEVETDIDRDISLAFKKTASDTVIPASRAIPGTEIRYTMTITNTGNVTLSHLSIADSMKEIGTIAPEKTWISPGESTSATATHRLTQSEIDAGSVTNTATASGGIPDHSAPPKTSTVTTRIEKQTPRLSIEKTVDKTSLSAGETRIGAKLSYGFTVTNTGNVAIKGISIDDRLNGLGDIKMSYPSKTRELAPGEKATGKASYSITNADILAGVVTNTAKAVGKNATTGASVESGESTVTTRLVKNPSIKIEKTADPTHIAPIDAVAGKEISYSFKITNTGNVNLGDIAVDDSMKDLGTVSPMKKSLAPGESTTARATHRVTAADIEAGTVTNTAKATGSAGGTVIKSAEATAKTSIEKAVSRMSFEKTVDRKQLSGNEAKAGTTLTYSFKISNDGNIPINGVSIDDGLHGLSSISIDWHGHDGTIPAGSSVTGTATYKVTQEDVDAGKVDNSATASGTDAHGGKLSKTSTVSTKIERTGKLKTVKSVDAKSLTGDRAKAGTVLTYTVTVRNTGNVTLRNVACDDSMKEIGRIALNRTELAPGIVVSGTATHTVTQADVDAGTVVNSASSSADSPDASKVVSNRSTVSTSIESLPQLTVAKTAGRTHIPADEERVGEVIPYSLTVSNTGNVTVSGIELDDELAAKSLKVDWGGNASHTLAPGQSVPASASYAISDTDVDRGIVENTAQADGKAPNGSPVKSNVAKAATTIEKAEPALALVKTGTEQVTRDDVKPGHEVEFDFELENIGNTTLKGISVKDALRGIGDIELERDELAAGEKTSGKATYRLTQDDIDAGFVKNSATAMAKTPTDVDVESNESSHTVTIVGSPSLSIEKKVDRESVNGTKSELRNTELTYSFTVTNTGTTTVSGIGIDDELDGLGEIKFGEKKAAPADTDGSDAADTDADGDDTDDGDDGTTDTAPDEDGNAGDSADDTDGDDDASDGEESSGKDGVSDYKGIVLAPGESIDATATYKLSDSDIDAGTVVNKAKAKGTLPNGDEINSDESKAVTKITVEADAVMVDLMQTGMTVTIPAAIAIAGASVIVSIARRRRSRM